MNYRTEVAPSLSESEELLESDELSNGGWIASPPSRITIKDGEERLLSQETNMVGSSEESLNNGGMISSPVPSFESVQEMVRSNLPYIPDRFIQRSTDEEEEEDKSRDVDMSVLSPQIPIIDLALLSMADADELQKLELACRSWGFFMVINHGISGEVLERVKISAAGFFELPFEEKKEYSFDLNERQGYGRPFMASEEEKLDWTDSLSLRIHPYHFRRLKFWPTTPPDFRENLEAYSNEVRKVAEKLLAGSLSLMMGMNNGGLLELHREMPQTFRLNYYPICRNPNRVIGISPHSDMSSITILLQDDDITGLEIRHAGGWVPVKPIPNSLIVNIGDVIEIWSNGKYKSVEHRAKTNEKKARMSLATFFMPARDAEIEPLDHLLDPRGSERKYNKVKYGDYLAHSLSKKIEGKTNLLLSKSKDQAQ